LQVIEGEGPERGATFPLGLGRFFSVYRGLGGHMEEKESLNDNEGGFAGFGAVAFSATLLN
jgi:hypothetical protein